MQIDWNQQNNIENINLVKLETNTPGLTFGRAIECITEEVEKHDNIILITSAVVGTAVAIVTLVGGIFLLAFSANKQDQNTKFGFGIVLTAIFLLPAALAFGITWLIGKGISHLILESALKTEKLFKDTFDPEAELDNLGIKHAMLNCSEDIQIKMISSMNLEQLIAAKNALGIDKFLELVKKLEIDNINEQLSGFIGFQFSKNNQLINEQDLLKWIKSRFIGLAQKNPYLAKEYCDYFEVTKQPRKDEDGNVLKDVYDNVIYKQQEIIDLLIKNFGYSFELIEQYEQRDFSTHITIDNLISRARELVEQNKLNQREIDELLEGSSSEDLERSPFEIELEKKQLKQYTQQNRNKLELQIIDKKLCLFKITDNNLQQMKNIAIEFGFEKLLAKCASLILQTIDFDQDFESVQNNLDLFSLDDNQAQQQITEYANTFLAKEVDNQNLTNLCEIAIKYKCIELGKACMEFIIDKFAKETVKSCHLNLLDKFEELKNLCNNELNQIFSLNLNRSIIKSNMHLIFNYAKKYGYTALKKACVDFAKAPIVNNINHYEDIFIDVIAIPENVECIKNNIEMFVDDKQLTDRYQTINIFNCIPIFNFSKKCGLKKLENYLIRTINHNNNIKDNFIDNLNSENSVDIPQEFIDIIHPEKQNV